MGEFVTQDIANTTWAFATTVESNEPLFATLARYSVRLVGSFTRQELSNTAFAFAKVGESDAFLFAILASVS